MSELNSRTVKKKKNRFSSLLNSQDYKGLIGT